MRVYSQSQGKFIEKPLGGEATFGGETPSFGEARPTGRDEQIRQLLGIGALGKKQYGTAAELLAPEPSTDVTERVTSLNQASPVVSRISSLAMTAPAGMKGWWKAMTGKIPGVAGGEAESLDRTTTGFARLIADTFATEVGVATDKDIRRWKAIMPRVGDTEEERREHSLNLVNQIISEAKGLEMEVPATILETRQNLLNAQGGKIGAKDLDRYQGMMNLYSKYGE